MLVSICVGTVEITVHQMDLFAKQRDSMKILPIYCYNVDDNVLMTTKKQRALICFKKVIQIRFHTPINTPDRLQSKEHSFVASKPFVSGVFVFFFFILFVTLTLEFHYLYIFFHMPGVTW